MKHFFTVDKMNNAYKELNEIWNSYADEGNNSLIRIIALLNENNIQIRQKDGALKIINLSIPTSK